MLRSLSVASRPMSYGAPEVVPWCILFDIYVCQSCFANQPIGRGDDMRPDCLLVVMVIEELEVMVMVVGVMLRILTCYRHFC